MKACAGDKRRARAAGSDYGSRYQGSFRRAGQGRSGCAVLCELVQLMATGVGTSCRADLKRSGLHCNQFSGLRVFWE